MRSSAPCLWGTKRIHKTTQRCWEEVIPGTGYCQKHQPDPYSSGGGYDWKPPKGWGALRERVMARDDGVCYICGQPGADQVDHIKPKSQGGSDAMFNLAPIHEKVPPYCHRKKTSREGQQAKMMMKAKRRRG